MAAPDFTIGQYDLLPEISGTLKDANGAVNISGATVEFHMWDKEGVEAINAAATIVSAAAGTVKYTWIDGDTDTNGDFRAEFKVIYSDTREERFPNRVKLTVRVEPSPVE